ncbi:hypothetical protein EC988_009165, partial [Linderina pennispora]
MSGEPRNTTIDPTLLQSLAQQHIATSPHLSSFSQLQITTENTDMDTSSRGTAPININRGQQQQQQIAGSAASFGTDYERSGLAGSFHQMQQQHFHHQQQHGQFRPHLGSPGTEDFDNISPTGSYPGHSLAAMAGNTIPTGISSNL